jgi:glycosyltransferase involved in cell wall biosynthesis
MSPGSTKIIYVHFNTAGGWLFGKYAYALMNAGAQVEIASVEQPPDQQVSGSYDRLVPTKVFGSSRVMIDRSKLGKEWQRLRHRFASTAALRALRRYIAASRPTHLLAGDPPGLALCVQAAQQCGAAVVYTPFEFYPKVAGDNARQTMKYQHDEQQHIRQASAVVFLGNTILEHYRQVYPALADKSHVIYSSWPGAGNNGELRLRKHANIAANRVVILYQGIIEKDRGLLNVVRALGSVPGDPLFIILGYGSIAGELQQCATELGLRDRLLILPPVPQAELVSYTRDADIGIIPLLDAKSYRYACPGKLFEYIAAGLALVVSDMPDLRKIVQQYELGEVYPSASISDLARALARLTADTDYRRRCAANSRKAQSEELCWEKQAAKFCGIVFNLKPPVCAP